METRVQEIERRLDDVDTLIIEIGKAILIDNKFTSVLSEMRGHRANIVTELNVAREKKDNSLAAVANRIQAILTSNRTYFLADVTNYSAAIYNLVRTYTLIQKEGETIDGVSSSIFAGRLKVADSGRNFLQGWIEIRGEITVCIIAFNVILARHHVKQLTYA